ncbi:hypothetical protein L6452_16532 [Arctium lappa]|uniref:Uncharacterized protein n=1 Tax=Arctium lappa TaxID=4217 RepID=A0ACB9C117_ARCLA|nr:hypothetical protein L6452_16532 [Arctium lappa]
MDNSDYSRNRHNEHLGVNKIGKNIRKSPLHQPNFTNPARQQPQPQVYNINKNDFRNIVQQLTGSPSHHSQEPLPRPPLNPPKSPSMRLQRIRPPPLSPISVNRPRMVIHPAPQMQSQHGPLPGLYGQQPPRTMVPPPPQPQPQPPFGSGNHTAESPISSYMRYLQHSINDSPQGHPQVRNHMQVQQQQSSGLLPYPPVAPLPSPRTNGPPPFLSPRVNGNGAPPLASPRSKGYPPLLPSPTSQFLLPSPSGYLNLSSPRSPYPLLSPGYQHPPPLTPNIPFSPMAQPGILGPGPQPPPSPGMAFPLSPGFFRVSSPRWRD